jgi:GH24 family phage-related lysozyme (muramidase)
MLDWNTITNSKAYSTERFDLLELLEGSTRSPYVDTVGDPTIGIGFNLVYNLEPVLRVIVGSGNWSDTLYNRLKAQVDKSYSSGDNATLIANLDKVMADWHRNHDSDVPSHFRFGSDAQILRALNALAPKYDAMIDKWLDNIPDSRERAALFSMTWNAPSLLGPKLMAAIESNDRAEAWYEIRYNSNGSAISGIANRRYVEADTFGLFHTDGKATYAEAVQTGEMLASHRDKIARYEATYDPVAAGQVKGVDIATIADESAPAILSVLRHFELSTRTHVEELLAASSTLANVSSDGTAYDSTKNDDDLILGTKAANKLSGGSGKDILIGLGGRDKLEGGAGADLFVFASIKDSPSGANADTIVDFGSTDRIALNAIGDSGSMTFLDTKAEAFSGTGAEIRWSWSGGKTIIEADVDGDGGADLKILLAGKHVMTESDFLL